MPSALESSRSVRSVAAGLRLLLQSLAEASGLHICIHDISGFTRCSGKDPIPTRLRTHAHPFCKRVKRTKAGLQACIQEDSHRANAEAGRRARPLVKRCHAGALEVVVPVMLGQDHLGSIFAGPVQDGPPKRCGPLCSLPSRPRAALLRLGRTISVLAGFAAHAGEALLLQRLETDTKSEPVLAALRYVARHFAQPVTVADAARENFLSPSRFAHVFRDEMGMPFHQYLNTVRISRAKSLLANSSMRILDVAEHCGFCNQNYFANVFKRHTGQTPRGYRASQQESIDI